jgi:hypothetical protein
LRWREKTLVKIEVERRVSEGQRGGREGGSEGEEVGLNEDNAKLHHSPSQSSSI